MSVETQIFAILKAACPRVDPVLSPAGTVTPRITYQRISGSDEPAYENDGTQASKIRVQVDVWDVAYGSCRKLADQIIAALYAGMTVGAITHNPADFEQDTKLYRSSFDVEAWE